jgi:hypothetical protein
MIADFGLRIRGATKSQFATSVCDNAAYQMSNPRSIQSAILWPLTAMGLYGVFAGYLYWPHLSRLTGWEWLLPVSAWGAACGEYLLSRRWVAGFSGSLLAGLVYGFGPFLLGLARFHPVSSLLAAGVPWLFVPAAVLERRRGKWWSLPLWLLPFAVIALFFYLSAGRRLFAAPLQTNVRPLDLLGFIAPLALIGRSAAMPGVYHVPVAALVLGLAMVWKARRYGMLVIAAAGLMLAFSKSFLSSGSVAWLGVSPILWLSIPMLWCAVWGGIGLQGLIEAGPADGRWVLAGAILLGILAIVSLLLAVGGYKVFPGLGDGVNQPFLQAGEVYLVGTGAIGFIYLLTCRSLRLHGLRWAILCAALGVDIFFSATCVADKVF